MLAGVNHCGLLAGGAAPENEGKSALAFVQYLDDTVGKALPTLPPMTVGLVRTDRENRVQQQHPLLCPVGQIPVFGDGNAFALMEFTEDVLERRRRRDAAANRETQAMSLAKPVIRILSQHDNPHTIKWSAVKCAEDLVAGGEDAVFGLFFHQKSA